MTHIETMKQWLDALEECRRDPRLKYEHPTLDKAITSLRQSIATEESSATQEPVAWMGEGGMKAMTDIEKQAWIQAGRAELVETYNKALYTHPQPKAEQGCDYCKHPMFVGIKCKNCGGKAEQESKREWVGLTEEEVIDLWPDLILHQHVYKFWQNLEAKLKEKNT